MRADAGVGTGINSGVWVYGWMRWEVLSTNLGASGQNPKNIPKYKYHNY